MEKSTSALQKYATPLKALTIAIICVVFALCNIAQSMEEDHLVGTGTINQSVTEESCTHWGLKHWVYGIKEYVIDRCLCCTLCSFNSMDEDRKYTNTDYDMTSDCCLVACSARYETCCYNNPIGGTLCLPLAALTHLMGLPCACCSSTKENFTFGSEEHNNTITIIYQNGHIGRHTLAYRHAIQEQLNMLGERNGGINRCFYGLTPKHGFIINNS